MLLQYREWAGRSKTEDWRHRAYYSNLGRPQRGTEKNEIGREWNMSGRNENPQIHFQGVGNFKIISLTNLW